MTNAIKDNNNVPTILGVLNTDGATSTVIKADPSTHYLDTSDGSSGSDLGNDSAGRDQNSVTTLSATDSNGNIIPLYADSSGNLLINSM